MGRAGKSLDDVVKRSGDTAGAASTVMGRMVQSARLQSDAWGTVGSAALGVGTAMTAVNVAVAKTGIEYQMLQQSSRAALTVLMNGAEGANAQMDKLDAFARTSPFAKDVFIKAQQQMLGFGIEAGKVVPYLDAIQQSVAATGGSNQDISELTRIFSQVQAAAKLTAVDLMQFGQRGIDAATLIGSQMGKTGAQIRSEITEGTLDAGEALDALAGGMQQRFGGASENVKNTLVGAFDRVKAAWRDLSAELMSDAVGTSGGGWLVGATNGLADLLRVIQNADKPTRDLAFGLSAIAGVSLLGVGGVLHTLPRLLEFKTALDQLAEISPRTASGLGSVARVVPLLAGFAAAGVAARAFNEAATPIPATVEQIAAAIERSRDSITSLDEIFNTTPSNTKFLGLFDVADPLANINDLETALRRIAETPMSQRSVFHPDMYEDIVAAEEQLGKFDEALKSMDPAAAADGLGTLVDQMVNAGIGAADIGRLLPQAAEGARQALLDLQAQGHDVGTSWDEVVDVMAGRLPEGLVLTERGIMLATEAAEQNVPAVNAMSAGLEVLAAAAEEQARALDEARNAIVAHYDAVLASESSAISLEASFDRATEAAEKNGKTLDINTEKGRANREALLGIAGAAIKHAEDLGAAGASTDEITSATQRAREQFVKAATDMGMSETAAADYADQLGLIPSDVATSIKLPGVKDAQAQADLMWDLLAKLPPEVRSTIRIGLDKSGYWEADRILNSINGRTATATVTIRRMGQAAMAAGGHVADYLQGLAYGGQAYRRLGYITGAGSTTADQVPTLLSAKEFVQNATATAYYGVDTMYALNARQASREAIRAAVGLAEGGRPGYTYRPVVPSTTGPQATRLDTAQLADAVAAASQAGTEAGLRSAVFELDGRPLDVRIKRAMSQTATNIKRGG